MKEKVLRFENVLKRARALTLVFYSALYVVSMSSEYYKEHPFTSMLFILLVSIVASYNMVKFLDDYKSMSKYPIEIYRRWDGKNCDQQSFMRFILEKDKKEKYMKVNYSMCKVGDKKYVIHNEALIPAMIVRLNDIEYWVC